MVFDATSRVSANGFIASTAGISNFDFMRGSNFGGAFTTASTVTSAAIDLRGEITTLTKGAVAIIGPTVTNTGTITANQGMVILAAVDAATVDYRPRFSRNDGLALLTIAPNSGLAHGFAVSNSGTITSNGGQIALQSAAANSGQSSSITNSGTITATTYAPGSLFNQTTMRGSISISAEAGSVLLTSSSVITANGTVAAGIISIGGDFGGANLNLPNSHSVVMQDGAKISASGEGKYGHGGDISIWGTGSVAIGGTILARGGQETIASATDITRFRNLNLNDGGLVEVSSLGDYELTAVVDTSAREGYGTTGTPDHRSNQCRTGCELYNFTLGYLWNQPARLDHSHSIWRGNLQAPDQCFAVQTSRKQHCDRGTG